MIIVKRYDLGTGSLEILAEVSSVPEALSVETEYLIQDHGTDVVVWHDEVL